MPSIIWLANPQDPAERPPLPSFPGGYTFRTPAIPPGTNSADLFHQYRSILCADELARLERFHFEPDRAAKLVAHELLRLALSDFAGDAVCPDSWRLESTVHGRPQIQSPESSIPLYFSLSHTRDLVACLVTDAGPCGIDVDLPRHTSPFRLWQLIQSAPRLFP